MISDKEIKAAERCMAMALEKGARKARVYLTMNTADSVGTLNGQIDKVFHSTDVSLSMFKNSWKEHFGEAEITDGLV